MATAKKLENNTSDKSETFQKNERVFIFGKSKVNTTHLNKIFFPGEGITKGEVIQYYISIADFILPYLKGRPESLLRNPDGINEPGFFQKDAGGNTPSFVKNQKIFSKSNQKEVNYIVCDNKATLIYLINLGCIEINPWHSDIKSLNKPDYIIIDIDPSEKNTFSQVIKVANIVKEVLDESGASSYCKTSGATGIHVFIPAGKKYTYIQVKEFARKVCLVVNKRLNKITTLERNLKKRQNNQIYLDYLQNSEGQTIASVYSLRPRPGATVSAPLEWNEVKEGLFPSLFSIHNIEERIRKKGDLFGGVLGEGIDLNKCLAKLQI